MKRKKIYSTYDIAQMFNVDITTVQNWVKDGKLGAYRTPGGHRRITLKELRAFASRFSMPAAGFKSEKISILIADNEEQVRSTVRKIINKSYPNSKIYDAPEGFSAGKILASEDIDLLVLDIRMPRMDGFEVMGEIKKDSVLGSPAIIVITGYPEKGLEEKVKALGAEELLIKPFEISDFKAVLKKALGL
ncbi:MAG: response regulator [Elusimicrobiota bacterium]